MKISYPLEGEPLICECEKCKTKTKLNTIAAMDLACTIVSNLVRRKKYHAKVRQPDPLKR